MKFLIIMSDNRLLNNNIDEADYNSLTASINYEYCKKYNYDFLYYRPYLMNSDSLYNCIDPNSNEPRHAAWSKLLSIELALELDYDYLIYIDSDCIFKNFDISLEKFLESNFDKDIVFISNTPWGNNKPCSGFFITKVCDENKKNIKLWYNYNIPLKNQNHAWEQDALWEIYKTFNFSIIDSPTFFESKDQFLRHIPSYKNEKRKNYFLNFILNNNINYSQNINFIKTINYNTENDRSIIEDKTIELNKPILQKKYNILYLIKKKKNYNN